MNDIPHFGVDPIDPHTLGSRQDKVNNIKRYGFSGRTRRLADVKPSAYIYRRSELTTGLPTSKPLFCWLRGLQSDWATQQVRPNKLSRRTAGRVRHLVRGPRR